MIRLEPLTLDEADAFVDEGIWDFLAERSESGLVGPDEFEHAKADQLRVLLPDGVHSGGHRFAGIDVDGARVGRIWFGPLVGRDDELYVYDVRIDPEHRRRGHARRAMDLVIDEASRSGALRVGLTVTEANHAAIGLYAQLGFITTRGDATQREMWLQLDSSASPG